MLRIVTRVQLCVTSPDGAASIHLMELAAKDGLFRPHRHFDDAINRAICQSEIDGGVHMNALTPGTVLQVDTCNHSYRVEYEGGSEVTISGHPEYCPEPVRVLLAGSTWGTPLLKERFIGREMRMEFIHPLFGVIRTSRVREIRELALERYVS